MIPDLSALGPLPATLALVLACAGPVRAQEDAPPPRLAVELNAIAPTEGGCRLTFLVRNELPADLSALSLETVVLTSAGQVERLTLFDFGAVPAMRPRVRQFDIAGLDCGGIGQVLVNGVAGCAGDGIDPAACLAALKLSSRIELELLG